MQKIVPYLVFFALLAPLIGVTAQKKTLQALKTTQTIAIDGKLDESAWEIAQAADGFVMFEPDNGLLESNHSKTEVKILYNDNSIYIGAILYDNPNLINKEITQRDRFGVSDHFGIFINGFNDGQQDFRFFVSAAGVQMDCLALENFEDFSWDAIWNSQVRITEIGWVVEMEIPFAALRFSKNPNQTWGLNFLREIRRDRQKLTWNFIDRTIGTVINQAGILTGIENITPPTRLFFIPYTSGYVETLAKTAISTAKVGMDLKYGITDSFTLDAILVPDFGQAAFDNVVLNLGPFEQEFNENRPFFTEGTDLFSKGNLLYSRRIGGPPSTYPNTLEQEQVVDYPNTVNLVNAVKISGRTADGLGIGFLNAITEKTTARVRNTNTNESRHVVVEPLTNYNVVVFDQRFNKNSSVSLINTNVTRLGDFRDANASAILFNLNTAENKYNFSGDVKVSTLYDTENTSGFSSYFNVGKTFGTSRFGVASRYVSKKFDINDLGINFVTNFHNIFAYYNYRILNPTKRYNSFRLNTDYYLEIQNTTGRMQEQWFRININSTTLKNDYLGYTLLVSPLETFNFYESRVAGRFLSIPQFVSGNVFFSSNYNRSFAVDFEPSVRLFNQNNRWNYNLFVSPRYRFNDRFTLIYSANYNRQNSDIGWVDFQDNAIILAERNRSTFTNSLHGKYAINDKMTLNLASRHYFSFAENLKFHTLLDDGRFVENQDYTANKNVNFNLWNFDLSYSWWFAPGSQITALYRNNAQEVSREINKNYGSNVSTLFENNLNHVFSISLRYFIDYNSAKSWFKKA